MTQFKMILLSYFLNIYPEESGLFFYFRDPRGNRPTENHSRAVMSSACQQLFLTSYSPAIVLYVWWTVQAAVLMIPVCYLDLDVKSGFVLQLSSLGSTNLKKVISISRDVQQNLQVGSIT